MSEVKRYEVTEMGPTYHKRTEMLLSDKGWWVDYEDYAALQQENESNLKSAQYAAETNRKVVRKNEDLSDKLSDLQQKLDAVLAENVVLKDINAWCKTQAFENMYCEFKTAEAIGCPDVDCMHDAMLTALMHAPLTPATDAILNEVRAEGADAVAEYHKERFEFLANTCRAASGEHKAAYLCALDVAAQLRAGSTEGGV